MKDRFFKKEYKYDWWFVFDEEQEYHETLNEIPFEDTNNLIPMSEEQVIELLNEFYRSKEYWYHSSRFWKRMVVEEEKFQDNVIKVLEKKIKHYEEMAVALRHDKYANGMCHDVLEVLNEIKDELYDELYIEEV